jgi:hypothetical protein
LEKVALKGREERGEKERVGLDCFLSSSSLAVEAKRRMQQSRGGKGREDGNSNGVYVKEMERRRAN